MRRRADVVAGIASAVTVAGMIATPLARQGGRARRLLSTAVVSGMFATTAANAARRWGTPRAVAAAASTAVSTGVLERVGTRTGRPFGQYAYTRALRPQVAGVPAIVPLAWFGMGLPSREAAASAARALGLGPTGRRVARVVGGAAAMTAWDLFLDPQMTSEGYWGWARRGRYRGIPLTNFVGWFVSGIGLMLLFEVALPHADRDRAGGPVAEPASIASGRADLPDRRLVGEYGYMAVMQTVGFARYFRDPLVAAVGGTAMLPIAGLAAAGCLTPRERP